MQAVFFDIDGTILETHGAGREAFSAALREVYGLADDLSYVVWAGATDLLVLDQVAQRNKTELTEDKHPHFFEVLSHKTDHAMGHTTGLQVFPGVSELIAALHEHPMVSLGLITGNARGSAFQKLKHVGLDHYFDHGGFGDQHGDRNELARLAKVAASELTPALKNHFVLGDTPADIRCAHAIGAQAIGVATGHFDAAALTSAGAHHVFEDFSQWGDVLKILSE